MKSNGEELEFQPTKTGDLFPRQEKLVTSILAVSSFFVLYFRNVSFSFDD